MIPEIKHPCYTFSTECSLWEIKEGRTTVLKEREELPRSVFEHHQPKIYITNPDYDERQPNSSKFKEPEDKDLVFLSNLYHEYEQLLHNPTSDPITYLNNIFLQKLKRLEPFQVEGFLNRQFELFCKRSGQERYFINYTNLLIKENPHSSFTLVHDWLDKMDPKGLREKQSARIKGATARQIALLIRYMMDARHVESGFLLNGKGIQLLEFLTGVSYENLKDQFERIGGNVRIQKVSTKGEIRALVTDLKTLLRHLDEPYYYTERSKIQSYIKELENRLENFKKA
jgi:hypothetical protein